MFAHLYAVYIAFNAGGLFAAFATFMMPFLAELGHARQRGGNCLWV
jgi:hypothetical protein